MTDSMVLLMALPLLPLLVMGIVMLARPDWCITLYTRWNALFGVDVERLISSRPRLAFTTRIAGVVILLVAAIGVVSIVTLLHAAG